MSRLVPVYKHSELMSTTESVSLHQYYVAQGIPLMSSVEEGGVVMLELFVINLPHNNGNVYLCSHAHIKYHII